MPGSPNFVFPGITSDSNNKIVIDPRYLIWQNCLVVAQIAIQLTTLGFVIKNFADFSK
jgi:hypothetical protein